MISFSETIASSWLDSNDRPASYFSFHDWLGAGRHLIKANFFHNISWETIGKQLSQAPPSFGATRRSAIDGIDAV
jgi:hypothetical protein